MGSENVSTSKIRQLTECSICLDVYKEPKILPCFHTFCLRCLTLYWEKENEYTDTQNLACPLCRKIFAVPTEGVGNLATDFLMNELLQIISKTNSDVVDKSNDDEDGVGTVSSRQSSVMQEEEERNNSVSQLMTSLQERLHPDEISQLPKYCTRHPDESDNLFCYDCKITACKLCITNEHETHKSTDAEKATEEFREQFRKEIDVMTTYLQESKDYLHRIDIDRSSFMKTIEDAEIEIIRKYDELEHTNLIESHRKQLINELNKFKDTGLKRLQFHKDEIEQERVVAETSIFYCREAMDRDDVCKLSRAADELSARSEMVLKTRKEFDDFKLGELNVKFISTQSNTSNFIAAADECRENRIGKLIFGDNTNIADLVKSDLDMRIQPYSVLYVRPKNGDLGGVTVLGKDVFVARHYKSHVDVYDSSSFDYSKSLMIPDTENLNGVVACPVNKCLYISDGYVQNILHRYDLESNKVTKWTLGGKCNGLSTTKSGNVLATLFNDNRVQVYTTHGKLVRDIFLDKSIVYPLHCVEMSNGNLVVCHHRTYHRVCVVNACGDILKSYGILPGKDVDRLNIPSYLAVDVEDRVYVADRYNNRVVLLNSDLELLGAISMRTEGPRLNQPGSLCLDERNNRLYVGEEYNGRLFVLNVRGEN